MIVFDMQPMLISYLFECLFGFHHSSCIEGGHQVPVCVIQRVINKHCCSHIMQGGQFSSVSRNKAHSVGLMSWSTLTSCPGLVTAPIENTLVSPWPSVCLSISTPGAYWSVHVHQVCWNQTCSCQQFMFGKTQVPKTFMNCHQPLLFPMV